MNALDKIGIYAIVNKMNQKAYIGSSINIQLRWSQHQNALIKNKHHSRYLQRAWNKYGAESFQLIVLETINKLELNCYNLLFAL